MHGHVFYSKEETILENDHNTKEVKKNVGKRSGSVASKKKKKIRGKKRKRRAKKSKESSSPKERREVLEGSSDPKCLTMDGPCDCEIYGLKKN